MTKTRSIAIRRVVAFMLDWLVILVWAGMLFESSWQSLEETPGRPSTPWVTQAIGFVSLTLPVVLYFSISESSGHKATFGKRALGLTVIGVAGGIVSFGRSLARSSIKFIPWEFGHIVANQAAFSGDAELPTWVYGPMAVAFLVPLWWLVFYVL